MHALILFLSTRFVIPSSYWLSRLARCEHPRSSHFLLLALSHFAAQTLLMFFTDTHLHGLLSGVHSLFIVCLAIFYLVKPLRNKVASRLLCISWLNAYCVTIVALVGNTTTVSWVFYSQIGATLAIALLKAVTKTPFTTEKRYFPLFSPKLLSFILPPLVCLYLVNQPLAMLLTSVATPDLSGSLSIELFQGYLHGVAVLYCLAFLKPLVLPLIKAKFVAPATQKPGTATHLKQDLAISSVPVMPSGQSQPSAHYLDQVSILFADMENFSTLMQHHATDQVVAFLHHVFNEFDELCTEFGVAKIKTVGDQYMAAAGVPFPHTDHASHCCLLALAMRARFSTICRRHQMHTALRIGISSGSVVAGSVGHDKRSYDLWGDAVNLAARMESSSAANKIQLSDTSYQLVCKQFKFEPVRQIPIKGFGMIRCHYLKEFSNETQSGRHKFLATILAKAT